MSFVWNKVNSEEMRVHLEEEWTDGAPAYNYEEIQIAGMDGSIMNPLNLQNVSKDVRMNSLISNHDAVMAWLRGSGLLEMDGRYRKAYIYGEIEPVSRGVFREIFTVPFVLDPYWYKLNDDFREVNDVVVNEGNTDAVPLILFEGSGDASVTINDLTFGISFDDEGTVYMDCLERSEDKPKCVSIGFTYPVLHPGINHISVTGNCRISMKRTDRWLG